MRPEAQVPDQPHGPSAIGRRELALVIASVVVSLGLGELACRALGVRGYHAPRTRDWKHALLGPEERLPGVSVQFRPGSVFELAYDSNPRGYFDARNAIVYHINRWGFRGPDWQRTKTPGRSRVAVLGDSFTFGEGVKVEDTFCARLPALLEPGIGREVEVLNLGTSAWTTTDEIHYLEQQGLEFEPDLVVVVYVLNDADTAGGLNLWENFRRKYEPAALRHSHFASWVFARIGRRVIGRWYVDHLVEKALAADDRWKRSFELLATGQRLAQARGADFVVAIFPFMYELNDRHPMAPVHRMIADHCIRSGIPVVDLLDAFRGQDYPALWVHPSDQHPNEIGHRIAAEALARFILERGSLRPAAGAADPH
jgi:lysophospholipase L1-like esterase